MLFLHKESRDICRQQGKAHRQPRKRGSASRRKQKLEKNCSLKQHIPSGAPLSCSAPGSAPIYPKPLCWGRRAAGKSGHLCGDLGLPLTVPSTVWDLGKPAGSPRVDTQCLWVSTKTAIGPQPVLCTNRAAQMLSSGLTPGRKDRAWFWVGRGRGKQGPG